MHPGGSAGCSGSRAGTLEDVARAQELPHLRPQHIPLLRRLRLSLPEEGDIRGIDHTDKESCALLRIFCVWNSLPKDLRNFEPKSQRNNFQIKIERGVSLRNEDGLST